MVLDRAASLDPGQDGSHLVVSVLGNKDVEGVADDVRGRVAVHFLGSRVPRGDDALERHSANRIFRMFDDRRHPLGVLEGLSPFGEIADRRDHQKDIPGVDVGQANVDRDLAAILSTTAEHQIESTGSSPGICEVAFMVRRIDRPETLRHQRLNGLANQVVAVIAEQHLGLTVDEPNHPRLVHPDQSVRHRL